MRANVDGLLRHADINMPERRQGLERGPTNVVLLLTDVVEHVKLEEGALWQSSAL
ncbi:hypothetical protein I1A62_13605 [Rhodococcus sp. USK10]|uniref:hypothetical protein n=1 Tax=Rhodococcus sp. USK10 TaxID=2789739 RepID=UPI001C5D2987|nr:hypothetical protein [Rhodococcus sp. USK10]QYB05416.1 hypothetical protein I1A62_13605 [Rhodococcus sp. USK10]